MNRDKIITFIDKYLNSKKIHDKSINGLQVEGKRDIKKILFAVSYSKYVANYAVKENFDTIIVHHGILWGENQRITGNFKDRLYILMKNNINLLAYHLPLDLHNKIGNNISLLNIFKAKKISSFGRYNNIDIGLIGKLKKSITINAVKDIVKNKINSNSFFLFYGKDRISKIAVVSGNGDSFFESAILRGADLFLTGEISEKVFEIAREYKSNFISAGHYRTEVFGMINLSKLIFNKFKVKTFFLDTFNPF